MKIAATAILEVLNKADIEGLLRLGAPADEYVSEAQLISEAIAQAGDSKHTQARVEDLVRDVWVTRFGPFSEEQIEKRSGVFSQVARDILGRYQIRGDDR
jgi:hypothetical protein